MKKIIVICLAALALASCKMDFYSSDSMTSAQLKSNPSSAVYTTDGIYTLLKDRIAYKGQSGGESGNYYIRHYFQLAELRGDNVTVSGQSEDPFTLANMYADDPTQKNIYYTWWIAYKIINAANSNIDAIQPGASELSDHLLGENYFFRALMHFHMVTLFAMPYANGRDNPGVVLRRNLDISTTTRATVGEVYDAIVEDLKSAKEYMARGEGERIKGNDKAYVSLDAARALLSRVYLYMGMNEECISECNELLDHAPASVTGGYDYADYPTHTYDHPETIWSRPTTGTVSMQRLPLPPCTSRTATAGGNTTGAMNSSTCSAVIRKTSASPLTSTCSQTQARCIGTKCWPTVKTKWPWCSPSAPTTKPRPAPTASASTARPRQMVPLSSPT